MNEKTITCHDCHGFKWKNINIYPILIVLIYSSMPFLIRCIVIAPSKIMMIFKNKIIIINIIIPNTTTYYYYITNNFNNK
jgi:hypothetical protein